MGTAKCGNKDLSLVGKAEDTLEDPLLDGAEVFLDRRHQRIAGRVHHALNHSQERRSGKGRGFEPGIRDMEGWRVLGSAHNDYHGFLDVECVRWERYLVTKDGEAVFDRDACQRFMHEAAALPQRQCEALLQKFAAAELRGSLVQFADETPSPELT